MVLAILLLLILVHVDLQVFPIKLKLVLLQDSLSSLLGESEAPDTTNNVQINQDNSAIDDTPIGNEEYNPFAALNDASQDLVADLDSSEFDITHHDH